MARDQHGASSRQHGAAILPEYRSGDPVTRVALIHGIGATSPEQWAEQSAWALASWWTQTDRAVTAKQRGCPDGCKLTPGHVHLQLSDRERSRTIDLEPLYWADCVKRPGAARCARLVLQAGLLIGLVDLLSAWLIQAERLPAGLSNAVGMTRTVARAIAGIGRALMAPLVTLAAVAAVLLHPRVRATVGDALAWTLDAPSHERVLNELTRALGHNSGPLVLIGHSQGGSIAAALEARVRSDDREVRLVTLGSGHGLLSAMSSVLPGWSLAKSVISWSVVLVLSTLLAIAFAEVIAPGMQPFVAMLVSVVRLSGYAWLTGMIGAQQLHHLLHDPGLVPSIYRHALHPSLSVPPTAGPAATASLVLALLLLTIGIEPARRLHRAALTNAAGIDVVATHDLVSATMLHLSPRERLRAVGQCGSLLFDHTTYLRNGWTVLPLIAEQIEQASGLCSALNSDYLGTPSASRSHAKGHNHEATSRECYHRAVLTSDAWSRPLAIAGIVAAVAWFAGGKLAPLIWIGTAAVCCMAACAAITLASVRRLMMSSNPSVGAYSVTTVESVRRKRSNRWWSGALTLLAAPLIGGAAVAFTTPAALHSLDRDPTQTALTVAAFPVGVALCVVSWRSLFGLQRESITALILLMAAIAWLLHGAAESTVMAMLVLGMASRAYRRRTPSPRLSPTVFAQTIRPEKSDEDQQAGGVERLGLGRRQ